MKDIICDRNQCNGCMACIDRCPRDCISVIDSVKFYNAIKDMDRCIQCHQCEVVCPNNRPLDLKETIDWKQGWAEEDIRSRASSGGAATSLMKSFIRSGGFVASCLFDQGEFLFDITDDEEAVLRFTGSKYVKSNPIGIYKKVQEQLKRGKVLFIGLPCQVAAMKNFIKDQENLYTIDLICHGTPSPKILKQFLQEYGYDLDKIRDIRFRKNLNYNVSWQGIDQLEHGRDPYMISFLNSIDYTKNCYYCKYATRQRVADLTLGDSWGTEYKEEERKGISLILVQTEKGRELLQSADLQLRDVDYENAVKANHQLNHPAVEKEGRRVFLKMLKDGKTVKQAARRTIPQEIIKQDVKDILIRLGIKK